MEATFKGNHKAIVTPLVMVATCTEHTRSRNMEATFKGNHTPIVNPSWFHYYMY